MSNILTTIVVKFEGNTSTAPNVVYEGDPTRNVNLDGTARSSLTVDDDYFFLIHFPGAGSLSKVVSSAGQVFALDPEQQSREVILDFVELDSVDYAPSVNYRPAGPLNIYWIGNEGEALTIDVTELKAKISGGTVPCKAIINYPVNFFVFKLQPPRPLVLPPGKDTYDILIAIHVVA